MTDRSTTSAILRISAAGACVGAIYSAPAHSGARTGLVIGVGQPGGDCVARNRHSAPMGGASARALHRRAACGRRRGRRDRRLQARSAPSRRRSRKKEIALIGDPMNTAAQILDACRELGFATLASSALMERLDGAPDEVERKRIAPLSPARQGRAARPRRARAEAGRGPADGQGLRLGRLRGVRDRLQFRQRERVHGGASQPQSWKLPGVAGRPGGVPIWHASWNDMDRPEFPRSAAADSGGWLA